LRRRIGFASQKDARGDPGPGRAGIDVEGSYVRGIDPGSGPGIVAVRNAVTAEQGAPKTPAPASHEPAGILDDIVCTVLDDLPIDSEQRADRSLPLLEGIFPTHQRHDRARDHALDLRDVSNVRFPDLHRYLLPSPPVVARLA
jgi:hypothetical protein